MVHQPKQRRQKLDAKSKACIFMGYAEDTKGFRLYDPEKEDNIVTPYVLIVDEGCSRSEAQNDPVEFLEIEFPEVIEVLPTQRTAEQQAVATEASTSGGATEILEEVLESSFSDNDFEDANGDNIALPPQSVNPAILEQAQRPGAPRSRQVL